MEHTPGFRHRPESGVDEMKKKCKPQAKSGTAVCPECGVESDQVVTEYDRLFPLPAVRVIRFRCRSSKCTEKTNRRYAAERTKWEEIARKLPGFESKDAAFWLKTTRNPPKSGPELEAK